MTMKIIVREAKENEALKLNEFLTKLIHYEANLYDKNTSPTVEIHDYFERRVENPGFTNLVAIVDDKLVGFLHASSNYNGIKLQEETKIHFMFIEEEYRHQGIGTKLMEEYLKQAKEKGIKFVEINHYIGNHESEELYKKFGFEPLTIDRRLEL